MQQKQSKCRRGPFIESLESRTHLSAAAPRELTTTTLNIFLTRACRMINEAARWRPALPLLREKTRGSQSANCQYVWIASTPVTSPSAFQVGGLPPAVTFTSTR